MHAYPTQPSHFIICTTLHAGWDVYLNSTALKHPLSSTCLSSSCWNLGSRASVSFSTRTGMLNSLLALGMEVDAADFTLDLVEANVVEALEASARDGPYSVVGN